MNLLSVDRTAEEDDCMIVDYCYAADNDDDVVILE